MKSPHQIQVCLIEFYHNVIQLSMIYYLCNLIYGIWDFFVKYSLILVDKHGIEGWICFSAEKRRRLRVPTGHLPRATFRILLPNALTHKKTNPFGLVFLWWGRTDSFAFSFHIGMKIAVQLGRVLAGGAHPRRI